MLVIDAANVIGSRPTGWWRDRAELAAGPARRLNTRTSRQVHHMELDAVDEGVIVDRAGVCRASTKGLKIGLSRPSEILVGDRRERQQLDLFDLDHHRTAAVDASDLDLWSRPDAVGDGDGPLRYSIANVS